MKFFSPIFFIVMSGLFFTGCNAIRNAFTFYPQKINTEVVYDLVEGVVEKQVKTDDGEELEAFYFEHKTIEKAPLIIYFHGNAGSAYNRISSVEKIYDLGCNVLLLSYRGFGKSTGKPSVRGIYLDAQATLMFAIKTLGYK